MKSHASERMPEADLSAIYRYKEYQHSRSRSVLSYTGRHKKFQETNSIRLFNRARTNPCFFLSRLARIYARPRIPQAVPWLQEFSPKWKVMLASARLKPTCPHSSHRYVPPQAGTKKIPKNKFYQIVQSSMPIHSVPVASGHKKRSRSVVAAGPSRRRLPTLPLAQYHRRDEA